MKELRELRELGVKRVVFEANGLREVEFFEVGGAGDDANAPETLEEELELPGGFRNAAEVLQGPRSKKP